MDNLKLVDVTPENIMEQGLFCIKNIKSPEFALKKNWFLQSYKEGLRIKILYNNDEKQIGYIEYVPANFAWRPIDATGFMFIQCMFIYAKNDKDKGYGSFLVKACEEDAKKQNMKGVCTMTSDGTFIANKQLFIKNEYSQVDKLERYELMMKRFNPDSKDPQLIDWTKNREKFQGWHLLYADQCPWHHKSVEALTEIAKESGIDLKIKKLTTWQEAKNAPSGFGVFSLLHNGKLLEDHYLSATRFNNILNKELK
ncbi:MAG: YoaP domain-containing protein [Candidatus Cloacimonadota bacterium]|nr:YoaP domain-containing protein [Candidatus Cloacimonadota bacterium]